MEFLKKIKIYALAVLLPYFAKAGCEDKGAGFIENPIKACTFADLIKDITQIILVVGLPLSALMIILAGFQFVTAQGNEEKTKKARQTFYWTIIGAAVIIGARVIAEAVVNFAKDLG